MLLRRNVGSDASLGSEMQENMDEGGENDIKAEGPWTIMC